MRPLVLTAIVAGALLAGCRSQAPLAIVVGDVPRLAAPGRTPTKEKPLYYYPVIGGFRELGATMAGDHPPPQTEVLRAVAESLARDHYLLIRPGMKPDLVMVIWWGSMNPMIDEMPLAEDSETAEEATTIELFQNKREMIGLVGALKGDPGFRRRRDTIGEAIYDDRYFIVVGAYEFAAAEKREKKLLWSARMSTESAGRSPEQVFPLLAASGAAVFGRETLPGVIDTAKAIKGTRVDLGELQVIENFTSDRLPAKK